MVHLLLLEIEARKSQRARGAGRSQGGARGARRSQEEPREHQSSCLLWLSWLSQLLVGVWILLAPLVSLGSSPGSWLFLVWLSTDRDKVCKAADAAGPLMPGREPVQSETQRMDGVGVAWWLIR
jgi:hypothetical protein